MFLVGKLFNSLWYLVTVALAVWATWWTYRDAKERQMLPWFWAIVSFVLFPLGFIIYLIVRAFVRPKTTT